MSEIWLCHPPPAGQSGPFHETQLRLQLSTGKLDPQTPAWDEHQQGWVPLWSLLRLPPPPPTPLPPARATAPLPSAPRPLPVDKNVSLLANEAAGCVRVLKLFAWIGLAILVLGFILTIIDAASK